MLREVRKEARTVDPSVCTWKCPQNDHAACVVCTDPCPTCKHSLTVHPNRVMSMDIVEEQLQSELHLLAEADDLSNHVWFDLRRNNGRPPTEENRRLLLKRTASKKKSLDDDVFNPLERGYELPRGRMVVILQLLRYFDMIFWPNEGRMRNGHLMTFVPRNFGAESNKVPNAPPMLRITLCSSILRISLFVLHELSPFSELADLNIRRIQQLVRMIDKLPTGSYPAAEWPLVIIVHITMAFRRITASLEGIFQILGVACETDVVPDGPVSSIPCELRRVEEDEKDVEISSDDPDTVQSVYGIFHNPAGKQLLTYVSSLVELLTVLYESHKNLLASSLGDKAFMALTLLAQRHHNAQNKSRSNSMATRQASFGSDTAPATTPVHSRRKMALNRVHSRSLSNSPQPEPLQSASDEAEDTSRRR